MGEDPALTELKALVVKRRWVQNMLRTNLGGATHHRNGWLNLKQGVYSNTERGDSRILQLCREMLGDHITTCAVTGMCTAAATEIERTRASPTF